MKSVLRKTPSSELLCEFMSDFGFIQIHGFAFVLYTCDLFHISLRIDCHPEICTEFEVEQVFESLQESLLILLEM